MNFEGREITAVVCDSRQAGPNTVFVCLRGARMDGHKYAPSAYDKGCRCFVAEEALQLPDDASVRIVSDGRAALAELSAECEGNPANALKIIGITGTKGKSTAAAMLWHVLNETGHPAALIGTTGIYINGQRTPTVNTTPESNILHRTFAQALAAGCKYVVMEVSSQATKMRRTHGITFDVGVFTNLFPGDHIGSGEHADFREYRECKAALFAQSRRCILNADDPESVYMASMAKGECRYYSLEHPNHPVDWQAKAIGRTLVNGQAGLTFACGNRLYRLSMPGRYNVANALSVIGVCDLLDLPADEVCHALSSATVSGRMEPVQTAMTDRNFIIDYAHNGVSLRHSLQTLREYNPGRLLCLFGSVGGRTQIRRKEMGIVAGELCDYVIISSDNPDEEDPSAIIAEIERYVGDCPHSCIPDRAEAIRWAVENSRPGDIVLFAGKGHEDYQLINGEHIPFCERELIQQAAAFVPAIEG